MKAAAAIELLLQILNTAGPVSSIIRQAHAEGRQLTREELQRAFDLDDLARDSLVAAIAQTSPAP